MSIKLIFFSSIYRSPGSLATCEVDVPRQLARRPPLTVVSSPMTPFLRRRFSSSLSPAHPPPSNSAAASLPSPPIATLLNACVSRRALEQVHARIIRKGLEGDNYLLSRFVSNCTSLSLISYASAAFQRVSAPNTCLWNSLLKGYCDHSSLAPSLALFSHMRQSGAPPDEYTLPSLLKRCSNELAIKPGKGVHGLAIKLAFAADLFVASSLVDLYGKCGSIWLARKVFEEMSIRNVVSWTAMIVGYVNSGELLEARKLFDAMPKRNSAAWNAMITGYVKLGDLKSARELFNGMPQKNVVSYTAMMDGYAKSGDMVAARALFDQCQMKDVVLWSSLISGYAQNGMPNQAVKVFSELQSSNVKPDDYVIVSLMSACSQLGDSKLAKRIDLHVTNGPFNLGNTRVAAALVDMNAKCGNIDRAMKLFNEMKERDLVSYCSVIQGLSFHGQGAEAVSHFYKMLSEGLVPDDVAFTVVLAACSSSALVEEGYNLFYMMRNQYSIDPSPDHYACMVNLLGRSGQLTAAYDLLKNMPIESHAGAWGALLEACRLNCDIQLGKLVAGRLKELEPCNAGNDVLLSNIYAAANQWMDVALTRKHMRDKGLQKIPGYSWI